MKRRPADGGFTLLEVLIAMAILVVGATSILGIFLVAARWQSDRRESLQIADLYNHALADAELKFNAYDPEQAKAGAGKTVSPLPPTILVDLRDPTAALRSADPQARAAAAKFPGCKYEVRFERNPWESGGASVVAHVSVWGLPSERDLPAIVDTIVMTRSGTPVNAFLTSPSMEAAKKSRDDRKRRDDGRRGG